MLNSNRVGDDGVTGSSSFFRAAVPILGYFGQSPFSGALFGNFVPSWMPKN